MLIKKIKIPKQIIILLILAITLNIARIVLFKNYSFLYMFWNVFLAFIPLVISSILLLNTNKVNIVKPFFIISFVVWLLFLPNAPYVVTDLIHLGRIKAVPVMFDLFLLFSFAWVSLLMGLYSLWHMEKMLLLRFSKKYTNIIVAIIILFTSFGIYLGRFLRFNSWDFFTSHKSLFNSILKVFTEPSSSTNVYAYTLLFSVFIYVSYFSFKGSNK